MLEIPTLSVALLRQLRTSALRVVMIGTHRGFSAVCVASFMPLVLPSTLRRPLFSFSVPFEFSSLARASLLVIALFSGSKEAQKEH